MKCYIIQKTRNNKCINRLSILGYLLHLEIVFTSDSISTLKLADFGSSILVIARGSLLGSNNLPLRELSNLSHLVGFLLNKHMSTEQPISDIQIPLKLAMNFHFKFSGASDLIAFLMKFWRAL